MISKDVLSLYFIMGSQDCKHHPPLSILKRAIEGGITCFQFREKGSHLNMRETLALGQALRAECRKHRIPFIVNDRIDVALLLEADGVHVGQEDIPAKDVRRLVGHDMWIGVSARTMEEATEAIRDGADYIGVGPMYPTRSKRDAKPPVGTRGVRTLRRQLGDSFPIVAIGGIDHTNASAIMYAGADGIAVISAIAGQDDPADAARQLSFAIQSD